MLTSPVSTVLDHLALVAVYGACDEVALSLAPSFRFHIEGLETDRWGYLALIDAEWAAWGRRPPLDVQSSLDSGRSVAVRLDCDATAQFTVIDSTIVALRFDREPPDETV